MRHHKVDVAIIGGGPAGSTCGSLLKKYNPKLNVLILEREKFPRDHVGESQLPPISVILDEMGAWDKVEAADFPIKIGATYRWGNTKDLWDFQFIPTHHFRDEPRPAKFKGQRRLLAFQVDRGIYDKILLDHAAELGCKVREETRVSKINRKGNTVTGLELEDGATIEARYYVDCSGTSGILRRTFDVEIDQPTALRNVAFWDYWTNAEWAISLGTGATRVQVMSLGYGWLWFIPITPTRTSLGLVIPAEYYKQSGKRPEELYEKAIREDPLIASLIQNATAEGEVRTTKDWSFVSSTWHGENWFLAGESGGFADPILAAGLSMAHAAARECAYSIIELDKKKFEPDWIKEQYTETQKARVLQHIRFADFWYAGNGCFTDLKEHTREIARTAGLSLTADEAFQWLGTGGFISERTLSGVAGFPFGAVKDTVELFLQDKAKLQLSQYNFLRLNLEGAKKESFATYDEGKITRYDRYSRNGKTLPLGGIWKLLLDVIGQRGNIEWVIGNMILGLVRNRIARNQEQAMELGVGFLEAMIRDGWVEGEFIEGGPILDYNLPYLASTIHMNEDQKEPEKLASTTA